MKCEHCRFYKPLDDNPEQVDKLIADHNDISKLGFCFRLPPKSEMSKTYRIRNIFPIVHSIGFCGEYK